MRTWPVRDGEPTQQNYINPRATVHVQTGIAGVTDDPFNVTAPEWSAYRDDLYRQSYSRLIFHNNTHASFYQLYAQNGTVLDEFHLVQMNHGPF
jgi:Iron/zinc purple acid phosphatase-like protein C